MKKNLTIVYLILLMTGCTKKFDGKIETRAGQYYLVNTSTSQSYRFTIKKTELKDSSTNSYSTDIILLSPGDEKFLGLRLFEQVETISTGEDTSINIFTPTPEQIAHKKEFKKRLSENKGNDDKILDIIVDESLGKFRGLYDTLIDGKTMMFKYIYTPRPVVKKTHKFEVFFEITGQVKIDQ